MVGDGWLQGIVGDKFLPLTSLAFIIGSYKKIQSCHRERRKGGHWDGKEAGYLGVVLEKFLPIKSSHRRLGTITFSTK